MLSQLLNKFKYENLNTAEKETLNRWMESLAQNELTVDKIKEFNDNMIHAIEKEIADVELSSKKGIYLQARLKERLMTKDFLTAPEKAKQHIEQSLKNIK